MCSITYNAKNFPFGELFYIALFSNKYADRGPSYVFLEIPCIYKETHEE